VYISTILRFDIKQCHTFGFQAFTGGIMRWCLPSFKTMEDCGLKPTVRMIWCFHILSFLQNIIFNPQSYSLWQSRPLSFDRYHSVTVLIYEHPSNKMPHMHEYGKFTLTSILGLILLGYRRPILWSPRLTDFNALCLPSENICSNILMQTPPRLLMI
jgi:hypothetical protein